MRHTQRPDANHRCAGSRFAALPVALAVLLLASGTALAQEDFFRSSPGPLTRSHAELDNQERCNDCHTGGRGLSNDKCLACHDHSDLRKRIRDGKGYHASAKVRGKKCESCHLEHKGRSFDLMGWRAVVKRGYQTFDHKQTGWPLRGKHKAIDCSECHKNRNKQGLRVFLGEDPFCGSCHEEDQPHGFDRRAMMACERCHNESVWKPQKRDMEFDHDDPKDASMPLDGSHAQVRCSKCHPKARFNLKEKNPDFCGNCHDSPHDRHLFGKKNCAWCHSPKFRSLPTIRFAHSKRTRFDLAGAHGKLGCYECHTKKLGTQRPDKSCQLCHSDDNRHKNRFKQFGSPPKCEVCHPSSSWKPSVFNHNRQTKFKLTGKHAQAACRTCHRGRNPADFERFNPKTVGCRGCHKHKNVHDGEFKDNQCLRCHKSAGNQAIKAQTARIYHGPGSRFPLRKRHKKVKCAQCHINDVYENTPMECGVRCHEDSLHRGSLGQECSQCHSGGEWKATRFKHSEDTTWPLIGLHKTVPRCQDCHPARQYSETPKTCAAEGCHAKDDVHQGKLGDQCQECHVETGENLFDHNSQSDFILDGQHLVTKCSDCHPSLTFKPRPQNCFGCHPEPEVHKGQYGTICEGCHTTASWLDIRALHDVGDFALKGSHDNIPCVRCHKDNRPLAGSGNLCINCHRHDDIHANSLSPRCGECHTQWSFAPARFDHTTVGCFLTGIHRTMPCYDCHQTGNFGALSPQCYGCHRDTALARAQVSAAHAGYTSCTGAGCHNPNAWSPQNGGFPRESICR
ncbi:MAG: hypothetical protein MJE77_20200 [Proteobacteria bacterium]|nr:hypothetical protein [Pseudomonadota bacterium]